jgi:tetratricopeptide (TPR) repeat protein
MNTPNANGDIIHVVDQGETILGIAILYGVVDNQLLAYNNIDDPKSLRVGQEIRIPAGMMNQNYSKIGGSATSTPLPQVIEEARVMLGPFSFDWQKMNNCGPTTTHIMLSYYEIYQPQLDIAAVMKPNRNDKNVSPSEVVAYVREQGLEAFVGINGDIPLLERLLAANYPVMVEQWMELEGGVGHYRAVRGYDREERWILQQDSFLGPDIRRPYEEFNADWAYFNNLYIVFYPPEDEARMAEIIGPDWAPTTMWERALDTFSQQEGTFPLYGKAEALHQLGRNEEAVVAYEEVIAQGVPERYLWYNFGYLESLNDLGQYQKTLSFSAPILEAMELSEEIRYHRAVAYKGLGQLEQAWYELEQAVHDNPNFAPAYAMLNELPNPSGSAIPEADAEAEAEAEAEVESTYDDSSRD